MERLRISGKTFAQLTVLGFSHMGKGKTSQWRCVCSCGKETIVPGKDLKNGHTQSCGCLKHKTGRMKTGLNPLIHPEMKDIYWVAGIYEGEGFCELTGHRGGSSERVGIGQKDPWILERIKSMFGGSIGIYPNRCAYYYLAGTRARGFLMTIFSLLSPRRQSQIRKVLGK